eukprot:Hpha_TRINITY_DN26061_c0_g1::TRINITY_DN26061_c0_g1_i1::g.115346::m.115346
MPPDVTPAVDAVELSSLFSYVSGGKDHATFSDFRDFLSRKEVDDETLDAVLSSAYLAAETQRRNAARISSLTHVLRRAGLPPEYVRECVDALEQRGIANSRDISCLTEKDTVAVAALLPPARARLHAQVLRKCAYYGRGDRGADRTFSHASGERDSLSLRHHRPTGMRESGAVGGGGVLQTPHSAVRPDGTVDLTRARFTLEELRKVMQITDDVRRVPGVEEWRRTALSPFRRLQRCPGEEDHDPFWWFDVPVSRIEEVGGEAAKKGRGPWRPPDGERDLFEQVMRKSGESVTGPPRWDDGADLVSEWSDPRADPFCLFYSPHVRLFHMSTRASRGLARMPSPAPASWQRRRLPGPRDTEELEEEESSTDEDLSASALSAPCSSPSDERPQLRPPGRKGGHPRTKPKKVKKKVKRQPSEEAEEARALLASLVPCPPSPTSSVLSHQACSTRSHRKYEPPPPPASPAPPMDPRPHCRPRPWKEYLAGGVHTEWVESMLSPPPEGRPEPTMRCQADDLGSVRRALTPRPRPPAKRRAPEEKYSTASNSRRHSVTSIDAVSPVGTSQPVSPNSTLLSGSVRPYLGPVHGHLAGSTRPHHR